jgi:hypothetical protein
MALRQWPRAKLIASTAIGLTRSILVRQKGALEYADSANESANVAMFTFPSYVIRSPIHTFGDGIAT